MGFQITTRARNAADAVVKEPSIVLSIDGLDTKFGNVTILQVIRIGDEDLFIGDDWVIGGFRSLTDQQSLISFEGTTTSIKQQLDIDKGRGSSISSFEVSLVDKNNFVSEIISPGIVLEDILGRKAKIQLGFANNGYPEDFITIFRGIIDDIKAGAGTIKLNIAHPDQKKRSTIFQSVETALDGAITDTDTTITLDVTDNILVGITGPDMMVDPVFTGYVRIEDEIIKYTGVSGLDLTGCVRGQLGTMAVAHDDESDVKTFYRLGPENVVDLALKIMLSGWNGPFAEDVDVTNFNILGDATILANSIFFAGVDVEDVYGLVQGDYITTTGAANGANNVTLKTIDSVTITDEGSYIEINGVTFVNEADSMAVIDFRSQYDTLPSGLRMAGDEVDVAEHLFMQRLFLSNFDVDFYLKETIENAKEFIEQELYKPSGAYSLPRKSRASLGYFVAPIPGDETKSIGNRNIKNPSKLSIRRSSNKSFYNHIVYKFEESALEDKLLRGVITRSQDSIDRIENVGVKAMVIESKGMREGLLGFNNSILISNRRLDRYQFGAEFLEGIEITYGDGFTVEIGDILILDPTNLSLVNTLTGDRNKPAKLFEVSNIDKNIKTGNVRIDLLDTGFDGSNRYCLIGPSSRIKSGTSSTQFVIEEFYPQSPFGMNEGKKWSRYTLPGVKVRSPNFTDRFAQTVITSVIGNVITVSPALGFTPFPGDVLEFAQYNESTTENHTKYCWMTDAAMFDDGSSPYVML